MHSVANVTAPTTGSKCGTPKHPLDPCPEEQKMVTQDTDINPDPDAEDAGSNISARKVKKVYQRNPNKPKTQQQQHFYITST